MIYQLARPGLFCLDAERAHDVTIGMLSRAPALVGVFGQPQDDPVQCMGLTLRNRIGLAAGLDKDARCIDAWQRLGFGLIEIGTLTPRPQPGNPKPRVFRLPQQRGLINRLGFNNAGIDAALARIRQADRGRSALGINIGKNADTPAERALDDYRHGMEQAYALADYLTVNISSPNTQGLRDLQAGAARNALLDGLAATRTELAETHGHRVPVAVKLAPDLDADGLRDAADAIVERGFDAIIATNTTIDRSAVSGHRYAGESGGLSGAPLKAAADAALATLADHLDGACTLIGVGGVLSGSDAADKLRLGADLVQLYSGLIYRGPALVAECARATAAARHAPATPAA